MVDDLTETLHRAISQLHRMDAIVISVVHGAAASLALAAAPTLCSSAPPTGSPWPTPNSASHPTAEPSSSSPPSVCTAPCDSRCLTPSSPRRKHTTSAWSPTYARRPNSTPPPRKSCGNSRRDREPAGRDETPAPRDGNPGRRGSATAGNLVDQNTGSGARWPRGCRGLPRKAPRDVPGRVTSRCRSPARSAAPGAREWNCSPSPRSSRRRRPASAAGAEGERGHDHRVIGLGERGEETGTATQLIPTSFSRSSML